MSKAHLDVPNITIALLVPRMAAGLGRLFSTRVLSDAGSCFT
jgi:hypothetical protein